VPDVRITNPTVLKEAFQYLRVETSYVDLAHFISMETEGTLDLEPTCLHRLATGRSRSTRALDTPSEAVLLCLCLMANALRGNRPAPEVVRYGRLLLSNILDNPTAALALAELEQRTRQVTQVGALREIIKECMARWMP